MCTAVPAALLASWCHTNIHSVVGEEGDKAEEEDEEIDKRPRFIQVGKVWVKKE